MAWITSGAVAALPLGAAVEIDIVAQIGRDDGTIVTYGQSSGPIGPFDLAFLAQKESLYDCPTRVLTVTAHR